jgi:hypothetical protein
MVKLVGHWVSQIRIRRIQTEGFEYPQFITSATIPYINNLVEAEGIQKD